MSSIGRTFFKINTQQHFQLHAGFFSNSVITKGPRQARHDFLNALCRVRCRSSVVWSSARYELFGMAFNVARRRLPAPLLFRALLLCEDRASIRTPSTAYFTSAKGYEYTLHLTKEGLVRHRTATFCIQVVHMRSSLRRISEYCRYICRFFFCMISGNARYVEVLTGYCIVTTLSLGSCSVRGSSHVSDRGSRLIYPSTDRAIISTANIIRLRRAHGRSRTAVAATFQLEQSDQAPASNLYRSLRSARLSLCCPKIILI